MNLMQWFKRVLTYGLLLLLLAFPAIVYFNAQALTDWWQLRGYTPPASIVTLAANDTMTAAARHDFYVNHPDLESDAAKFRSDCRQAEQTIVLGCYHGNQAGIFIYNISDPRLAGIQQVTAAHEMLHAAYDRLSKSDKTNVDKMLQDFYDNSLHDQRITDTINSYTKTEPDDVVNEMHSVFGTEISSLPAPLEAYYSRYFSDRQAVTHYADSYQSEFTSREDKLKADAAQLDILKAEIDGNERTLNAQSAKIDSDRTRLNNLRSSGRINEYNAGVSAFNSEVEAYNTLAQQTRSEISRYNQLVQDYNDTAKDLASLEKSLDSRQPQSTQ